jgi:hypothetical protein
MKREFVAVLLASLCIATLAACGSFAETPGERFRKAVKEIEAACAKRKLGPNEVCGEVARLKPADPLATEEGRFAHSIRIPNPVPADSGYKPGMTPQDYFDHLCKTEAGEFIYKTVANVEGLFLMRPREKVDDYKLQHLYALEDPYAYSDIETDSPQKLFVNPPWWIYRFFETKNTSLDLNARSLNPYLRYSGFAQNKTAMNIEEVSALKSRYGYTWRGINRPYDRELGIVGAELIVMDLGSNEILAVRRGYIRTGDVRSSLTGVWWIGGHVCPTYQHANAYTYEFLSKVLNPIPPVDSAGGEGGSNAR